MGISKRPWWRILVLCVFTIINITAQPIPFNKKLVDSLTYLLPAMKDDTNKISNLILLSQMYIAKGDSNLIMKYANGAHSLAQKINSTVGRISALGQMAYYHATTGNWPQSILEINQAIPLTHEVKTEWSIFLYNLKFINYASKNDLKQARIWALKALQHPDFESGNDLVKWPTYMQLGLSYEWENRLDSAQFYADILKEYLKKYDAVDLEANTYSLLGNIARKRKNYEEALYYYRQGDQSPIGLAWTYDEMNNSDSSIYFAKLALNTAQQKYDPRIILESTQLLARLYSGISPATSNQYLNLYVNTKDTFYNSNKLKQMEEIRINEQQLRFDQIVREKALRSNIIQYSLMGLAMLLLISALFFYRNNQIKKTSNRQLEKAYKELTATHEALKSTQSLLIQSEKMASLGELTAGIAHEIQNPLNFVNNFSEVSKELAEELKEEANKETIDKLLISEIANDIAENQVKINHHGNRASSIVKGMLEHSRTSSGKKELTDINALADEYLRLAYHGLRAKDKDFNAALVTDFDPNLPKIEVIPQDIGRVLLNLINNGFQAIDEQSKRGIEGYKPTLTVTTKLENARVKISAKDNGSGIPEEIKDKIFQPFFTTKEAGKGTGLGLSLAYDIVKAHGGTIEVKSNYYPPGGEIKVGSLPSGRTGNEGETHPNASIDCGTSFIILIPIV